MKDEKKVKATVEAKKKVQPEEDGVELTDEELSKVVGGLVVRHESQEVKCVK